MKIKKEYILLLAIIVALSLYLFFRQTDRLQYELPEIPSFSGQTISKIEISKGDTSIILNKKNGKWYIAPHEYHADLNKVRNMLDTMGNLSLTAMVSESRNYARYHLDDHSKINVKAWAGDTLKREFEIGKMAASYQHTFVKLPDDKRVYHAQGNFRDRFDLTVDGIRDKNVLSFNRDDIQKIQIKIEEETTEFILAPVPVKNEVGKKSDTKSASQSLRADSVWQTIDGKKVDKTEVDGLLTDLSHLYCEKFIYNQKKKNLTDPIWSIKLNGSKEYNLAIFNKKNKDEKYYPAVSSESDYPFLLPDWQVDNWIEEFEDILKEPAKS